MKQLTIFAMALMLGFAVKAQSSWGFDKLHTNIGFEVTHLVITEVEGTFGSFDGELVTENEDFTDATINFEIDVNSIDTDNDKRNGHLMSDDFFNAAEYPKITFKGSSFTKVSGNKYKLTGDLTIRDITKEIELDVTYRGTVKDPYGNTKAGFKIGGEIDRFDYNLKWDAATEAGELVVSREVGLDVDVQLVKQ